VRRHFGGRLINCMSHANDLIYQTADSVLMRSSDDFYPKKTEMQGEHLQVNAHFGLWFGQFVHPDWDMFHSKHAWGAYHAAGRAVSGSPLYVSDKPGHHDVDVLRTLVLPDGRVLRFDGPGVPTRDCLFRDVRREAVALKVANRSGPRGVVGVFNVRLIGTGAARAEVRPADVPGLAGKAFALRRHTTGAITVGKSVRLSLPERGWEIVTIAPVERGVAAFGLADKLAGAAAIVRCGWSTVATYEVELIEGGDLALHCTRKVLSVSSGGDPLTFRQRGATVLVAVPTGELVVVTLTIAKR
jgi:raffinose synthase